MPLLLSLYAALLIIVLALTVAGNRFWARLALALTPLLLCAIIQASPASSAHGRVDLSSFRSLALAVALPLLGLALMALFVTRWRWLFWLVLTLNLAAGSGIVFLALFIA